MAAAVNAIPVAAGAWPLLGHLAPAIRDPLAFLVSLPDRGDLVRVRLGPTSAVVVCSPALVWQVLRNDRIFDRGGFLIDRLREVLGHGVATCPHDTHRRQRRLVQPAMSRSRLPAYARTMIDHTAEVTGSWSDGRVLDVNTEMLTITSRNTLATLLGNALPDTVLHRTVGDLSTCLAAVPRRALTPPLLNRLPTRANRRYRRARARMRHTLSTVIADRRTTGTDHGDLLSALLAARDPKATDQHLSDTEVLDEVITIFIGGTETTASALAWSLHLLCHHPGIADRMRTEVDTMLAGRPPTYADLPRLELTHRVVTEALRLWPPGWVLTRTVTEDTRLGGHFLPAGSPIVYSPYVIHHRPDVYDQPDLFDPDRWLPDRAVHIPREAYIPFGDGARRCLGDNFGMIEAVLVLAAITARWRLEPIPGQGVRPALGAILRPHELRMRTVARTVCWSAPPGPSAGTATTPPQDTPTRHRLPPRS